MIAKYLNNVWPEHTSVQTDDDSDIDYAKLGANFKQDLPTLIQEITNTVENQDLEVMCHVAHKLKGLSSSCGFAQIT